MPGRLWHLGWHMPPFPGVIALTVTGRTLAAFRASASLPALYLLPLSLESVLNGPLTLYKVNNSFSHRPWSRAVLLPSSDNSRDHSWKVVQLPCIKLFHKAAEKHKDGEVQSTLVKKMQKHKDIERLHRWQMECRWQSCGCSLVSVKSLGGHTRREEE